MRKYHKILVLLPFLGNAMMRNKSYTTPEFRKVSFVESKTQEVLLKHDPLPMYISIPMKAPDSIKNEFEEFFKFEKFYTRPKIYSTFFFDKDNKTALLSTIPTNINYSKLPTVVKNMLKIRQIIKQRQNETYFIVMQDCMSDFAGLYYRKMASSMFMNVILLITSKTEEIPFYIRSLSVYALAPFNVHDSNLEDLRFLNTDWPTREVEDKFLKGCDKLRYLDLDMFNQVTKIGEFFLDGCYGLISLSLWPLRKVTYIGEGFLSGCSSLTSLDLSPLSQVTYIGERFLYKCSELISLNLSGFLKVKTIKCGFLYDCTSLKQEHINTGTLSEKSLVVQVVNEIFAHPIRTRNGTFDHLREIENEIEILVEETKVPAKDTIWTENEIFDYLTEIENRTKVPVENTIWTENEIFDYLTEIEGRTKIPVKETKIPAKSKCCVLC